MHPFTLAFLIAVIIATATHLWLALRQIVYVRAHRSHVPQQFAEKISLTAHQKAADYSIAKSRVQVLHIMVDMAFLLILTLGGGLQFFYDVLEGHIQDATWLGIAFMALVAVVSFVVELPFSVYRTFVIEARFGFNKITLTLFVSDLIKSTLLAVVLGLPLLFCVLWLMEGMGANWWFYVWVVWLTFMIVMQALVPTVIAPLFNKFSPLQDAELKSRVESLLSKCGFKSHGVFVMDGSKRSSHGNAYFTGFGKSKRIVFFDTLLTQLSPGQIEAVLAHELGHFKLRHVIKRLVLTATVSLLFLYLLGYLMQSPWFYEGLHVSTRSPAMSLILFFMVLPVFTFFIQPLVSRYSRKHEFEADRFAAKYANPLDLAQALVKLYEDNASTLTPDPIHSAFYDSHPPALVRIARLSQSGT